ncbi:transporter substrate-binding domain-containing protein [Rugamonas sp. FT103W]|uniref:Transporter substrate-binding domain-containing protein n=2 Tax=Rugamonas rivuli TaxID=2743358 RepID=A0A843SLC6_9BURK|nr:transporter substrate-binding domain-containing protein [Rugamonas rivuli]
MTGIFLAAVLYSGVQAHAAAPPVVPVVPLLIGDTLDEQGKPRPMPAVKRKVLDAVAQELGVTFEPRTYPWARAERYALDGVGLVFGLPKTADRLRALHYSDTASHNSLWLVTRSDATFPFSRLEDLRGKTVGTVRGYSYGEDFDKARGTLFRTDEDISSRGTRLTRLMLKRVDVVLLFQPDGLTAKDLEDDLRTFMAPRLPAIGTAANAGFSVLPKPLTTDSGQFFAIARSKDDGIIDRINAALARIRKREEDARRQRPPN